jgi:hypothetical protein
VVFPPHSADKPVDCPRGGNGESDGTELEPDLLVCAAETGRATERRPTPTTAGVQRQSPIFVGLFCEQSADKPVAFLREVCSAYANDRR